MDDIYRIQKSYAIPDAELRNGLKEENKEFVLPVYTAFLARYKLANFTKNPEKYIKYTANDVSSFINKFFDAAA